MTAIRPTDSALRDTIEPDSYNATLNTINGKFSEMEKFINNLRSDITSIGDFKNQVAADQRRGYDVGSSLDTLEFQQASLQIDLDFFIHMKDVYIKKLYGDLYKYCDGIIESALAIEVIPANTTREAVKSRKFRNMAPYPAPNVPNPNAVDAAGNPVEGVPSEIPDPNVKYDMNEIFALINCTTSNLRELAEDISSFDDKLARAREREARGFSVGNLIMNLEGQKSKLTLEFDAYIVRLAQFLDQNKDFSDRCLNRIKIISSEITTTEEAEAAADADADEPVVDE